MQFLTLPLNQAEGCMLAHKIYDTTGRIVVNKGRVLDADDIAKLNRASIFTVMVARLDEQDVDENQAAEQIAKVLVGTNLYVETVGAGRAEIRASKRGVVHLNLDALQTINLNYEGVTIATVPEYSLVETDDLIALIKIVPLAIPQATITDLQTLFPIVNLKALLPSRVALIVSGPENAQKKLLKAFDAPVRGRLDYLNADLAAVEYVAHDIDAISNAISQHANYNLILLAGYSAIMDEVDIIPMALRSAGGKVEQLGLPVDPGTMLMLGYLGDTPVIGAPGCIKTPKLNVIDLLLPRLLSGEHITRQDLLVLGHGGLLGYTQTQPLHRRPKRQVTS